MGGCCDYGAEENEYTLIKTNGELIEYGVKIDPRI